MVINKSCQKGNQVSEEGAALVIAVIILALMMAVSVSILVIANAETGTMGSDLRRTQTFYASASSIEYMSNNFSLLLSRKLQPTPADLQAIIDNKPQGIINDGYDLAPALEINSNTLDYYRRIGNLAANGYPTVTIKAPSPYEGLYGIITPYTMKSVATHIATGTKVTLQRDINSYAIPIFQFGIFGDKDIEFHPGPQFSFNGRVHSNRNLYLGGGDLIIEDKVTSAEEIVFGTDRNGAPRSSAVRVKVAGNFINLTQGSVSGGPNFTAMPNPTPTPIPRGAFPDSPAGTVNTGWDLLSISSGVANNNFAKQVLTRSTGAKKLLLPLQLDGASPIELIRRATPSDTDNVSKSRYYTKAKVRILLDNDANATGGVVLETINTSSPDYFVPLALPINNSSSSANALLKINSNGSYQPFSLSQQHGGTPLSTNIVRGVKEVYDQFNTPLVAAGAGIKGRIKIEITDASGNVRDVTKQILSMGVTVGEPNAIVQLQRPLWAAFVPGSRTRNSGSNLVDIINNTTAAVDGEVDIASMTFDSTYGFANYLADDNPNQNLREDTPAGLNQIVPLNVYNTREGWSEGYPAPYNDPNRINERGMTSIVEINMKNLSRWLAGYYDNNLLAGTPAVSTNMTPDEGFVVYVSDRRGDSVTSGPTNGIVDNNADIYSNSFSFTPTTLDPGEDVINGGDGIVRTDPTELPRPGINLELLTQSGSNVDNRRTYALNVAVSPFKWQNYTSFRRAVRLFDGADLNPNLSNGRISDTNGITMATENMVYIWGSYNTTGINWVPGINNPLGGVSGPAGPGATRNENFNLTPGYGGDQVPASIVCDAFFPLSRTWFDALPILFPDGNGKRFADTNGPSINEETAVRAAIIAGNNRSAMAGEPDQFNGNNGSGESRLSGGVHNFPRFLETWGNNVRWNYTGSLIILYYSNQALGAYNASGVIYQPPNRNWSFDITFRDPRKLPPGTPFFEYIQPTNFRQLIATN